jgi:alkyl sulfatase BDS1-like metallo-beta-lactamase superfamily hydrolase
MTELRFEDRRDFEDANRGFIAKLDPGVVTSRDGRVVWDSAGSGGPGA